MPTQINSNYSVNFQKFVDFANKAYATKGEDTVVRFSGMPSGDYKGSFASFFRTSSMKTANDQVREIFKKTVADMFGGVSANLNCGFVASGISSNEHMAVTFSLSRDHDTGAITIKYSEPKGFPVKFSWTTTIDVDGKSVSTPMLIG